MEELKELFTQRDELNKKIREIEINCEGIENENNSKRVQELNIELSKLYTDKKNLQSELSILSTKISEYNTEISKISETSTDKILEAIKKQRWYFFRNKTKVLMDRDTGLLWANLNSFPYNKDNGDWYNFGDVNNVVSDYNFDGIERFRIPTFNEIREMIQDKSFPFQKGDDWQIMGCWGYATNDDNSIMGFILDDLSAYSDDGVCVLPCSSILVEDNDYKSKVAQDNSAFTEKERLQFTLNLFVENDLQPTFEDEEITKLYDSIYIEKPKLLMQLQGIQAKIESLQKVELLSSHFEYELLLSKYDINAIDSSIIKYYKAVQQWTDELINKLDYYEKEMEGVISDFNLISLKLAKKYENIPNLTEEENALLCERQNAFQNKFCLGMTSLKEQIIAVKKQADDLEYRIDEINKGTEAMYELACLEDKKRMSFSFLAENTATIIKNALLKIEYFQDNRPYIKTSIDTWEKWSENYKIFKTTYNADFKASCEQDSIETEIWNNWYEDWRKIRFAIEKKIQPVIERGLKSVIPMIEERKTSIPEQIIAALETYKKSIDKFYLEERKGIYQKFVFQAGGDLQDKFEAESELYKFTAALQGQLQDIIFNCSDTEDRVWILNKLSDLLDIQIDEILDFAANNNLKKIAQPVLKEFSELKKKDYNIYLLDAQTYNKEKARREKEFNSLIFKMRKDLMK